MALRTAACHAALKDEDPGLAGVGVFESDQQNSRRQPRVIDCGHPSKDGQRLYEHSYKREGAALPAATMTSRDIAELTGKRHDNVMRDARAMLVELHGEGGVLSFEAIHRDPQNGQAYPMLALPKRETLILVSGYSVAMRAKIIDRWQELEAAAGARQPALPNFADPVAAARAWADQAEQRQRLAVENQKQAQALAIAAPKADALDRIATATEGAVCLREAAKLAQVPERQFTQFLCDEGWIFKHTGRGGWLGRADKEAAGLLELKRSTFMHPNGTDGSGVQVLVTPRGLARLGQLIASKAQHLRKTSAPVAVQRSLLNLPGPEVAP